MPPRAKAKARPKTALPRRSADVMLNRVVGAWETRLWGLGAGFNDMRIYGDEMKLGLWVTCVDPSLEETFGQEHNKGYRYRGPLVSLLQAFYLLCTAPVLGYLMSDGHVGVSSTLAMTRPRYIVWWTISWPVCVVAALVLMWCSGHAQIEETGLVFSGSEGSRRVTMAKGRGGGFLGITVEQWCLLILMAWFLFLHVWFCTVLTESHHNRQELQVSISSWTAIQCKLWVDTYTWNSTLVLLAFWDAWLGPRTRVSFVYHSVTALVFFCAKIIATLTFKDYYERFFPPVVMVSWFQGLLGASVIFQAYAGSYKQEVRERLAFLSMERDSKKVRAIQLQHQAKRRGKGATLVEKLLGSLNQAQADLLVRAFEAEVSGDPHLLQVNQQIENICEIIQNTEDLFAVGLGGGVEDDEESRFLHIYMGQGGAAQGAVVNAAPGADTLMPYPRLGENEEDEEDKHLDDCVYWTSSIPDFHHTHIPEGEDIGTKPSINILALYKRRPHVLYEVGFCLLQPLIRDKQLQIDRSAVSCYLLSIESRYYNNPYHNRGHGAMVAHMSTCIVSMLRLKPSDTLLFSLIIAALGHDVGHCGRNNQFIASRTDSSLLAQYYGSGFLENYHCYLTFRHANISDETNIFKHVETHDRYRLHRKQIIDLILATDMAEHFSSIGKFRLRRQNARFDPNKNEDDLMVALKMIIKLADLSHVMVDWRQHLEWSLRVTLEFYYQGDLERQLGFDISPLCDRLTHKDFPKSQSGFIQFVVLPLANELTVIDKYGSLSNEVAGKIVFNKNKWDWLKDQTTAVELATDLAGATEVEGREEFFQGGLSINTPLLLDDSLSAHSCFVAPLGYEDAVMCLALTTTSTWEFHDDPMMSTEYSSFVETDAFHASVNRKIQDRLAREKRAMSEAEIEQLSLGEDAAAEATSSEEGTESSAEAGSGEASSEASSSSEGDSSSDSDSESGSEAGDEEEEDTGEEADEDEEASSGTEGSSTSGTDE